MVRIFSYGERWKNQIKYSYHSTNENNHLFYIKPKQMTDKSILF